MASHRGRVSVAVSALVAELSEALSHFESDDLVQMLAEGGIVAGAIRSMDQVQAGRAGVSADLFVQVQAAGRAAMGVPGLPMALAGTARQDGRLPGQAALEQAERTGHLTVLPRHRVTALTSTAGTVTGAVGEVLGQQFGAAECPGGLDDRAVPVGHVEALARVQCRPDDRQGDVLHGEAGERLDEQRGLLMGERVHA